MLYPRIMSKKLTAFLIIFCMVSPSYGFYSKFLIPSNPEEEKFLNQIENYSDIKIGLLASGVEPEKIKNYEQIIIKWKNNIDALIPNNASDFDKAKITLNYLHDSVYKKYRESATTLKEIIEKGEFNCLSSTILVNILLRMMGIEVQNIVLPSHIYTIAILDGQPIEIENTIREGVSISDNPKIQKQFNALTGFRYKQPKNKKAILSWDEAIGFLYSNRAYFNSQKKQYNDAFQNTLKAQVFLGNTVSEKSSLMSGYLNYAFHTAKNQNLPTKDYQKIKKILEEGIILYPDFDELKINYLRTMGILLTKLIDSTVSEDTVNQTLISTKPYINDSQFQELKQEFFLNQTRYYLYTNTNLTKARESLDQAWNHTQNNYTKSLIQEYSLARVQEELHKEKKSYNKELIKELSLFPADLTEQPLSCYYSGIAHQYYQNQEFEQAIQIMDEGKKLLGKTSLITQNGFYFAVNSATYFLNKNDFKNSLKFYKKALDFEKNPQILQNISIIYENLAIDSLENNNKKEALKLLKEGLELIPSAKRLSDLKIQIE